MTPLSSSATGAWKITNPRTFVTVFQSTIWCAFKRKLLDSMLSKSKICNNILTDRSDQLSINFALFMFFIWFSHIVYILGLNSDLSFFPVGILTLGSVLPRESSLTWHIMFNPSTLMTVMNSDLSSCWYAPNSCPFSVTSSSLNYMFFTWGSKEIHCNVLILSLLCLSLSYWLYQPGKKKHGQFQFSS